MAGREKKKKKQKRRVRRTEWLEVALEALEIGGVEAVRVERLASKLGVAKSGFYWHFGDRQALLAELLRYWADVYTGVVVENEEIRAVEPEDRLRLTTELIARRGLARFDLAMRLWAQHDPKVAERVSQVYEMRLGWLRELFRELGFEGEDLEMRARLYACYHSWESTMFWKLDEEERARLAERRIDLLLSPAGS